jgi:galacturan 1,4-alpha-galacturonidase
MIVLRLVQVLWLLFAAVSAAMIKNGTTCTVTPISGDGKRSVNVVDEREILPLFGPGLDEHYPRPDPATGKRDPQVGFPMPGQPPRPGGGSTAAAGDDTPQILDAFKQCGKGGTINITQGVYNIRQVMNTTDLQNVDIHIYGTLIWDTNIQYWLRSSFSVTYAGRSTAWLLGGNGISMRGHGKALFNGNGQTWYDQNRNQGNQNGRPISLTIWRAKNVFIDGITWRQTQFWHTFVAYSQNVTMTNLDMNATSSTQWSTVNTDGTDTWNSKDVTIANWTVTCGDVRS